MYRPGTPCSRGTSSSRRKPGARSASGRSRALQGSRSPSRTCSRVCTSRLHKRPRRSRRACGIRDTFRPSRARRYSAGARRRSRHPQRIQRKRCNRRGHPECSSSGRFACTQGARRGSPSRQRTRRTVRSNTGRFLPARLVVRGTMTCRTSREGCPKRTREEAFRTAGRKTKRSNSVSSFPPGSQRCFDNRFVRRPRRNRPGRQWRRLRSRNRQTSRRASRRSPLRRRGFPDLRFRRHRWSRCSRPLCRPAPRDRHPSSNYRYPPRPRPNRCYSRRQRHRPRTQRARSSRPPNFEGSIASLCKRTSRICAKAACKELRDSPWFQCARVCPRDTPIAVLGHRRTVVAARCRERQPQHDPTQLRLHGVHSSRGGEVPARVQRTSVNVP
jgi:hypothetical protein